MWTVGTIDFYDFHGNHKVHNTCKAMIKLCFIFLSMVFLIVKFYTIIWVFQR